MRLKLIYNPAAGRGRAMRHIRAAERHLKALGAEVDPYESVSADDLTREAAASSRNRVKYDRVVVCGGDGTVNLALRDFDLEHGTLGIIPLGSGDDFAQVMRIPKNIRAACEVAVRGRERAVDVATADDFRYLGVASVGFDSEVARFANEKVKRLRGSMIYLYSILRVLPRFQPRRVRINGRDEEIMLAVFANSPRYGGGVRIAPAARLDDRQLDVCIVHRTSRTQLLWTLPRAYNGGHVRKPFVEMRRGAEFRVESNAPMDIFADGEMLTRTPVTFRIAAHRLRVVVPSL